MNIRGRKPQTFLAACHQSLKQTNFYPYNVLKGTMHQECILDSLIPKDESALVKLFTCPIGRQFLGGAIDHEQALKRSQEWIARSAADLIWAIRRTEDGELLGYVTLHKHHDGTDIEISYELLKQHWGNGYATEALSLLLEKAHTEYGLETVVAETQAKNHKSIALLKRVGVVEDRRLVRFDEEQIIFRGKTTFV